MRRLHAVGVLALSKARRSCHVGRVTDHHRNAASFADEQQIAFCRSYVAIHGGDSAHDVRSSVAQCAGVRVSAELPPQQSHVKRSGRTAARRARRLWGKRDMWDNHPRASNWIFGECETEVSSYT